MDPSLKQIINYNDEVRDLVVYFDIDSTIFLAINSFFYRYTQRFLSALLEAEGSPAQQLLASKIS